MRQTDSSQLRLPLLLVGITLSLALVSACNSSSNTATGTATSPATQPAQPAATTAPAEAQSTGDAKRGDYLATIFACKDCHTLRQPDGITLVPTMTLAGGQAFAGPWGTIHSANITQIAPNMPAADLSKLIRGQLAPLLVMPTASYNQMSEQDMSDLIAYLHTLQPITVTNPPADQIDPNFKMPSLNAPVPISTTTLTGPTAEHGGYLITLAGCDDCHTPSNAQGAPDKTKRLSGVENFEKDAQGNSIHSANLTPDQATGLGGWTDAQIIAAIRTGIDDEGHQLHPLMPYASAYHAYTDEDVAAVVAYLRTLPAVSHPMPENPTYQAP